MKKKEKEDKNMIKTNKELLKIANTYLVNWNGKKGSQIELSNGDLIRLDTSNAQIAKGDKGRLNINTIKLLKRFDFKAWLRVVKKGVSLKHRHFDIEIKAMKTVVRFSVTNTRTGDTYTASTNSYNELDAFKAMSDKSGLVLLNELHAYSSLKQASMNDTKIAFKKIDKKDVVQIINK